jgi:hypothetical protein
MTALDPPNDFGKEISSISQDIASLTPLAPTAPKRKRSDALKLSPDEVRAVRAAVRKLWRAFGSFHVISAKTGIPANTLRRVVNPNGIPPTGTLAIRLAAVAGVPVEVLLGGKVIVTAPIIGRAA